MRIRHVLIAAVLALAALALAGCRTAPVHNIQNAPITPMGQEQVSMEDVKDAIIGAGAGLGWRMKPVDTGHMVGTLNVRDHMAKVDIRYSTDDYDIVYKDSRNLNHTGNEIHSNYNGWVQNLDNAIQNRIAAL